MKREDRKLFNSFKKATANMQQEVYGDCINVKVDNDFGFGFDGSYLWAKSSVFVISYHEGGGHSENVYTDKTNFLSDLKQMVGIELNF